MFREIKKLKERVLKLEKENYMLKGWVESVNKKLILLDNPKKTVSQLTTQEDEPITPAQVLDEWLNGDKDNE